MGDTELKDKLRHLLEHWIQHNEGHAAEYEKWAQQAKGVGLTATAERIEDAAQIVSEANRLLGEAVNALAD